MILDIMRVEPRIVRYNEYLLRLYTLKRKYK